jgi:hypothetical protein
VDEVTEEVDKVGEGCEEGVREGKGSEEGGKETRPRLKSIVAFECCRKSAPKMGCETLACRKECTVQKNYCQIGGDDEQTARRV